MCGPIFVFDDEAGDADVCASIDEAAASIEPDDVLTSDFAIFTIDGDQLCPEVINRRVVLTSTGARSPKGLETRLRRWIVSTNSALPNDSDDFEIAVANAIKASNWSERWPRWLSRRLHDGRSPRAFERK